MDPHTGEVYTLPELSAHKQLEDLRLPGLELAYEGALDPAHDTDVIASATDQEIDDLVALGYPREGLIAARNQARDEVTLRAHTLPKDHKPMELVLVSGPVESILTMKRAIKRDNRRKNKQARSSRKRNRK